MSHAIAVQTLRPLSWDPSLGPPSGCIPQGLGDSSAICLRPTHPNFSVCVRARARLCVGVVHLHHVHVRAYVLTCMRGRACVTRTSPGFLHTDAALSFPLKSLASGLKVLGHGVVVTSPLGAHGIRCNTGFLASSDRVFCRV